MEVAKRTIGSTVLVEVRGDLDRGSAPVLDSALAPLVEARSPRIVLDLGKVDLLDSTGLGVLVKAFREVTRFEGTLEIAAPNRTVRKVLEVTGLASLLRIHEAVEDAVDGE